MEQSGGDRHHADLAALHVEYLGTVDGWRRLLRVRRRGREV